MTGDSGGISHKETEKGAMWDSAIEELYYSHLLMSMIDHSAGGSHGSITEKKSKKQKNEIKKQKEN